MGYRSTDRREGSNRFSGQASQETIANSHTHEKEAAEETMH